MIWNGTAGDREKDRRWPHCSYARTRLLLPTARWTLSLSHSLTHSHTHSLTLSHLDDDLREVKIDLFYICKWCGTIIIHWICKTVKSAMHSICCTYQIKVLWHVAWFIKISKDLFNNKNKLITLVDHLLWQSPSSHQHPDQVWWFWLNENKC